MVPKKASPEAYNTGSVDSITVADVIARLTVLKPPRMGEMISALRTACRVLNAEPSTLPAELGSLRRRLAAAAYAVAGIKRGRWNNVRCLTLKALELAGLPTMPGRSMQPLLPSWEAIKALLPDKSSQHSLSKLMSYCSRAAVTARSRYRGGIRAVSRGARDREPRPGRDQGLQDDLQAVERRGDQRSGLAGASRAPARQEPPVCPPPDRLSFGFPVRYGCLSRALG